MSAVALENTYSFWTSNMRGDPDVKFISQFNSIQVFWEQFRAHPVSSLPDKTYLHVFKGDIKPLWEDPCNFCGGHFKLTAKSQAQSENMWVTVLLNMLGEQFPNSELVNGASVMSNQVGNNLVKVWLATTDKVKVQATREFLLSILDAADFMSNVTFVPHKLVVKGAGKKVSNRITDAPARFLAVPGVNTASDTGSVGSCSCSEAGDASAYRRLSVPETVVTPSPNKGLRHRQKYPELSISTPNCHFWPCPSPVPRSPESAASCGLYSFGGALSSIPSSRCSEFSSMPPSPRPVSPTASYTGSEWEADCGMKFMPPSPAMQQHYLKAPQQRSWSISSQDSVYTHNPYSFNTVTYASA